MSSRRVELSPRVGHVVATISKADFESIRRAVIWAPEELSPREFEIVTGAKIDDALALSYAFERARVGVSRGRASDCVSAEVVPPGLEGLEALVQRQTKDLADLLVPEAATFEESGAAHDSDEQIIAVRRARRIVRELARRADGPEHLLELLNAGRDAAAVYVALCWPTAPRDLVERRLGTIREAQLGSAVARFAEDVLSLKRRIWGILQVDAVRFEEESTSHARRSDPPFVAYREVGPGVEVTMPAQSFRLALACVVDLTPKITDATFKAFVGVDKSDALNLYDELTLLLGRATQPGSG